MKNAKKRSILAPLSAGFCATVLAVVGGLSANVSYASVAAASVVGSSSTGSNYANSYITFKDANLKKALLKTMKNQRLIDANASEITHDDAKKLSHADITSSNVKNLSGIENFTNLNRIDFDHNSISDLSPLASITSLESIYATYNKISDLTPLQSLSSLKCLRASSNKITDFSTIGNLTSLETLYLGENPGIKNFDTLRNFTNLTDLNLDSTQFSDLNIIKDLTKLKLLYLQSTDIADLSPIEGLTKLETLVLYGNKFTSLEPLKSLTNLKSISLGSENGIKSISALEKLPQLNSLSMYGLKFSLSSEQQSTPLGIEYADKLSFSSSVGSVEKGSFVLNDSINLPYKDDVTIEFKNDKSFKIGNVTIGANGYNGKIKLHLNVPKIETVEGKMTYEGDASIDYNTQKKISDPVKGKKKRYKNGHEDTIVDAKNGLTKVGNKEVVTEDIEPGTIYQADSSLVYKETHKTLGTKGTRTVEKFHSVDPNTGAISTAFSSNSGITKKAIDTVIKVGNKEVKTEDIQPGTKYEADSSLAYKQEQTTEGTKGTKTTTTIYKVDENKGLTNTVQSSESKTTTAAKDKVIKVGNVKKETTDIDFQTTYEDDSTLDEGTEITKTEGKKGSKTVITTYEVDAAKGLTTKVAKTETKEVQPTNKIVLRGTKKKTPPEPQPPVQNQKTVTFNKKDGTLLTTVKVETGKKVAAASMPAAPVEDGFTFKEWNTQQDGQGKAFTADTVVSEDLTVYAVYTKNNAPQPPTPPDTDPSPDPSPDPNPNPNPNPDPTDTDDNNGGGSIDPDWTYNPELNIGSGNDDNNSTNSNGSINDSANGSDSTSGSDALQADGTRSADTLPNTGSNASGTTFASFGAMVLGLFAASGAAVNRKRAKHLR